MLGEIDNKKLLSETIGMLRFPLMVCVVLTHIYIPNQENYLFVDIFDCYVVDSFVRIAVPLFFFISGFLFFVGIEEFGRVEYWNKLIKRGRRLLVPYLFWGIFAIGIRYIQHLLGEDDIAYLFDGWLKWIYYIVWNPINYQLWFVRDLLIVVLLSPIIYFFIKRLNFLFVLVLGAGWLFWHKNIFALFDLKYYILSGNVFDVLGFDFVSLFFFSFGAWFALCNKNFALDFKRLFTIEVVSFVVCTICKFIIVDEYYAEIFNRLAILFELKVTIVIVYKLVSRGKVKRNMFLENGSLFIYYYHAIFLMYFNIFLFDFLLFSVENESVYFLVYLFIPIVVILIGLWLYKVGMMYCPKVMKVVLGLK